MVLGAKGGVGSAAILLAKALGAACVVAVTRGAEGREVALACGADAVIDASDTDLRDSLRREVYAATDGRGVDVVIDPVGGAISEAAVRAMAWGGRLVIIGFASGGFPVFKGNYLLLKGLSVTGFQWTEHRDREIERVRAAQAKIFDLWSAGRLSPLISKQLPLEDFKQALSALQDGRAQGKIILCATG
nr:zinc-binding dehydrogenase [Celeribacter sp. PS-C1]